MKMNKRRLINLKFWNKINAAKWICICAFLFAIYLAIDIADIPTRCGFMHINENVFSAFVNAFIVIVLYIISYFAIEKRQQKKDDNAKEIARLLIESAYNDCVKILKDFEDEEKFERYIKPKIEHGVISNDKGKEEIINGPFKNSSEIMQLSESGYVTKRNLEKYLRARTSFNRVISNCIFWMYEYQFYNIKDNNKQKEHCKKDIELFNKEVNYYITDFELEKYE